MSDESKGPLARFVPEGKNLLWVAGIVGIGFGAGVGWNSKTSALSALPSQVDSIQVQVDTLRKDVVRNTAAVRRVEGSVEETQGDVAQVLCLVKLIANNESPGTELNPRCP